MHTGRIASSLSAAGAIFPAATWSKINYVLNHKIGTSTDIQYAIWHYTDAFNPDPTTNPGAIDMISDADVNRSGFVPGPGDVVAALIIWGGADVNLQRAIIEVPPPTSSECSDRFTAGGFIFKNGKKATFGIQGGYQNGRLWGGINYIDHGSGMHVHGRVCTSYTVLDTNCRRATYNVTINGRPGTATVRICDYGEPGINDVVEIALSNGYSAGVGTTLGGGPQGRRKCAVVQAALWCSGQAGVAVSVSCWHLFIRPVIAGHLLSQNVVIAKPPVCATARRKKKMSFSLSSTIERSAAATICSLLSAQALGSVCLLP